MAIDIRPPYTVKLRYALKCACSVWLVLPAYFIATQLDVSHRRWESFRDGAAVLILVPLVRAFFWAMQAADVPRPALSWKGVVVTSAFASAVFMALAVLPYFRYTYVRIGTTVVRVDRITGRQCQLPLNACGYDAPYDPLMTYDAKTGTFRPAPGGRTVRDFILGK
jgi:hypothetical protein